MKFKITFSLLFGILLVFSCGQSNTPSSKVNAESNTEQIIPANNTTEQQEAEQIKDDLEFAEKELVAESMDSEKVKTTEKVSLSEKTTNPKPVKVNQKVETVKPKEDKTVNIEKVKPKVETKTAEVKSPSAVIPVLEKEMVKEAAPVIKVVKEAAVGLSHESFDQLLKKNVSAKGKVNYNNLKADEAKLDAYLKALDENPPAAGASRNEKMAYWINAYNAATIKLILKNYPVSSITKLHGGKPWDQNWIPLGGKTYTLNNIENDILRPVYKDARIHFAVNCAAKSCPPLLNRAWTENNLNRYLEQQTKAFINDPTQNTIKADAVEVSKIFEWYAVDFGNLIDFLNKYSTTKINPGAKITYKEYNWDLNK